jgi:PAS domain S-box-containing protein
MTSEHDEDELLRSAALRNAASILAARQRTEQRNEAYLAEAQRLSRTGSFGWNVSTGEIFWSEETFRIFGYDPTIKPTVQLVLQRVHPDDAARVRESIERASQDGQDFDIDYRLLLPDGRTKHVHVAGHVVRDDSEGIEFGGAIMDVTEHHQVNAALEHALDEITKSRQRLRLVINTIPGMVWSGLPDGSFDFVNEPWLTYIGLSWDELTAQGRLVSVVHPDDVEGSSARWSETRATGTRIDCEVRMRRADGQYRWFLTRAVPLRDEAGTIVRWYGTATDIEDRKRAEMLLAGEKRLLDMMARGESRALIFHALCRLVEELAGGSLASILLVDPKTNRLRHGAAPGLSKRYVEAIDGIVIGPSVGSCGTAAYRAEAVIVSDIAIDPLWTDFRDLALQEGLRACWSTPILSSNGRVLGTFAVYYREARHPDEQERNLVEQITHLASIAFERAQGEGRLREQAGLLDLTHDTVFVRDLSDVITYWNRGAQELYGWSKEEALDQVSHEIMQTIFPAPLPVINEELFRTGRWEGELIHTKRDGTRVVIASRWSLQRDEQGAPIAIFETNNDITDRKRTEAELRDSEKRYRYIFESTGVSIWEVDFSAVKAAIDDLKTAGVHDLRQYFAVHPEFVTQAMGMVKIRDINDATVALFRARSKQELMVSVDEVVTPDTQAACAEEVIALAEGKTRFESQTSLRTLTGERLTVVLAITFPTDPAKLNSVLISLVDVTEQKRAEDALRQAQADLTHVSRVTTLGEMAASIAHEVDQPLSGVVINATACLRFLTGPSPDLDEVRDGLQAIARDGRRASEVTSRIRALARRAATEKERLDINEVIREVVALAEGEARRTRARVRTQLAGDLPRVLGDPVQLQQVVLNLLLNGLEAMHAVADRPRELVISTQSAEPDRVRVAVRDAGSGIDPKLANRIFDAFYTTKRGGIGLGLSISRSIVEQHGGRLWSAPNDGPGTTFYFTV